MEKGWSNDQEQYISNHRWKNKNMLASEAFSFFRRSRHFFIILLFISVTLVCFMSEFPFLDIIAWRRGAKKIVGDLME